MAQGSWFLTSSNSNSNHDVLSTESFYLEIGCLRGQYQLFFYQNLRLTVAFISRILYDLETYPNTGFPRISASAIIEDKTNIPRVAFPVHCFQVELEFRILVFVERGKPEDTGEIPRSKDD